jgi:OOP family OmpA-OmpF porin
MDFITEYLSKYPEVKVEIVGYTDPVGNSSTNNMLSHRRAQRVKQLLARNHITADNITERGAGVYPIAIQNMGVSNLFYRRVEIVFKNMNNN